MSWDAPVVMRPDGLAPGWTVSPGPLALVGSGEYLPVMTGVEGMLLNGRPPRYVQIPTAAAPEGEQVLSYWLDLGAAQLPTGITAAGSTRTPRWWT